MHQAAAHVAQGVAGVLEEQAFEGVQAALLVLVLNRLQLVVQVRMAAHRALTEDHQRAGQDIRAFHGDRHGNGLIGQGHEVTRTHLHGAATGDVHAVVDQNPHHFRGVVLGHGRDHGDGAFLKATGDQVAVGFQGVGKARHFRGRFLHALEVAHGGAELAADA